LAINAESGAIEAAVIRARSRNGLDRPNCVKLLERQRNHRRILSLF